MKNRSVLLKSFLLTAALLLTGCQFIGASGASDLDAVSLAQTSVAGTMGPIHLAETMVAQTAMVQSSGGQQAADNQAVTSDQTSEPPAATQTQTPTPTITLTPTLSIPIVHVSTDTNCRVGPGKIYDWLGALTVGETAEVMARSADGQYWVIRNPDQPGGTCWLWGYYATVDGPIGDLPIWDPPPTPTPVVDWSGSWTVWVEAESSGPPNFVEGVMDINVTGDNFTGTLTIMGQVVDMNGFLNADRSVASGTWTSPYDSGPFVFHWVDQTQFNGSYDGDLGWCGAREGAAQPDPCFVP